MSNSMQEVSIDEKSYQHGEKISFIPLNFDNQIFHQRVEPIDFSLP